MIDKIIRIDNIFKEFLKYKIRNKHKPLILFGTGSFALVVYNFLVNENINVDYFCDNDVNKINTKFLNKDVLKFNDLKTKFNNFDVIIASSYYDEILKKLKQNNENLENIFKFSKAAYENYDNFYFEYDFVLKNLNKLDKVYNLLEDNLSKKTFINLVNHRISGDLDLISKVKTKNSIYFDNNLINLNKNDIILDVGAYNGDTLKGYLKFFKNVNNKYICMEPDKGNFKKIKEFLYVNNIQNVKVLNFGAWNKRATMKFEMNNSYNAKISDCGVNIIKCDKIDDILKNQKINFIKMDIEGAEVEALEGCKDIISSYSPNLAISIYHKKEDFYKIPLFIKKLNEKYKLYIRHYGEFCYDTVLYAIL